MDADLRRRAILYTIIVFALHAFALGGWLVLIPFVKESLGLNKAELALALLGLPVATIPSLQIAGRLIGRWGPRRILAAGFPLQAVAVLMPLLATSGLTLFLGLAVFGVSLAFLQVCLNVYAGRLEKQLGALVMNRCHGFWALGLMVAPLLVTALMWLPPIVALGIVAGLSSVVGSWAAMRLPKLEGEDSAVPPPRRRFRQIPTALFAISGFALFIAMLEGAMSDWASVYLAERLPEGSRFVGLGVSLYAGALAAGRLSGDLVKAQMGAVRLARLTIGIAIVGLLCLCLPLPLGFAYLGFVLVGAGASVGFPLGVSAVAALDDRYEGANIAIMSSLAIMGFLVGPPLIGFLSEAFTLRVGLAALLPGLCVGFFLAARLSEGESEASPR